MPISVGPLKLIHKQPAKFGSHRLYGSGNITVLVFHLILQEHVIKERAMRLSRWEPLTFNYQPANFSGHRHCGSGDVIVLGGIMGM